ncbi:hypothetical protein N9609_01330 [bacterium]|nr:hypothetical protein [bacterium]
MKTETISERVKQLIEHEGISVMGFEKKINVGNNSIGTGIKRKSNLSGDILSKILNKYDYINPKWLLTGKGEMLIENLSIVSEPAAAYNITKKKGKQIPLIPLDAMAGFGGGDMQVMPYETNEYIVPEFEDLNVEFMIRVKGSSMYPKYNSGDIVACKKLPLDTFFQWNKVYVLDTIQGAMIKRICESKKENSILCVSDNAKYTPFDLHRSQIHSLAIVLGVIRLE